MKFLNHCRSGRLEKAKVLVEKHNVYIDAVSTKQKKTALCKACKYLRIDIIKWLIFEKDAYVNYVMTKFLHMAPINVVCSKSPFSRDFDRRLEIVKVLVEANADLKWCDRFHGTPICITTHYGDIHGEIAKYLCRIGKVNINKQNDYGYNALHIAIENGFIELVKIYIEEGGAVPSIKTKYRDEMSKSKAMEWMMA